MNSPFYNQSSLWKIQDLHIKACLDQVKVGVSLCFVMGYFQPEQMSNMLCKGLSKE